MNGAFSMSDRVANDNTYFSLQHRHNIDLPTTAAIKSAAGVTSASMPSALPISKTGRVWQAGHYTATTQDQQDSSPHHAQDANNGYAFRDGMAFFMPGPDQEAPDATASRTIDLGSILSDLESSFISSLPDSTSAPSDEAHATMNWASSTDDFSTYTTTSQSSITRVLSATRTISTTSEIESSTSAIQSSSEATSEIISSASHEQTSTQVTATTSTLSTPASNTTSPIMSSVIATACPPTADVTVVIHTTTAPAVVVVTATSSPTPSSHKTTLILSTTIPITATALLALLLYLFFRQRSINRRRARELERRAEWLDPNYVNNIRRQMQAMDPTKVGVAVDRDRGNGPSQEGTELSIWNPDVRNKVGALPEGTEDKARWTNRGKMSGSLGSRSGEQEQDIQTQTRPFPRTRITDKGSPLQLPYSNKLNASRSGDLGVQRIGWSPIDNDNSTLVDDSHQQSRRFIAPTLKDSPSEAEWLSSSNIKLKTKSRSTLNLNLNLNANPSFPSLHSTTSPTDVPPPLFDPRGSMHESQIGLALPFPPALYPRDRERADHLTTYPYAAHPHAADDPTVTTIMTAAESQLPMTTPYEETKLTGDGYESHWRARSRGRPALGSTSANDRTVAKDEDEYERLGLLTAKGRRDHMTARERLEALETRLALLTRHPSREEGLNQGQNEEKQVGSQSEDELGEEDGKKEVAKSMRKERLDVVKGLFGRG
jgi:hypothetical protein